MKCTFQVVHWMSKAKLVAEASLSMAQTGLKEPLETLRKLCFYGTAAFEAAEPLLWACCCSRTDWGARRMAFRPRKGGEEVSRQRLVTPGPNWLNAPIKVFYVSVKKNGVGCHMVLKAAKHARTFQGNGKFWSALCLNRLPVKLAKVARSIRSTVSLTLNATCNQLICRSTS